MEGRDRLVSRRCVYPLAADNSSDNRITGFAFHVRGGDAAVGVVAAILDSLNLRAFDAQTGDFFKPGPEALRSFRAWRAFRDRVVDDAEK